MLDGHMRHEDHLGNVGELRSGGAQWMTAGRGIIHSEMPQQEIGRMRGFQLWINLPAAEKMKPAGQSFTQALPEGHNAFVYSYEGKLAIAGQLLSTHQAGVLSPGTEAEIIAHEGAAKFLMLAAKPLCEPVVQYGPFVMNSREEIEQAVNDYQTGTFAAV